MDEVKFQMIMYIRKLVDSNNNRNTKITSILDLLSQVTKTCTYQLNVLNEKLFIDIYSRCVLTEVLWKY